MPFFVDDEIEKKLLEKDPNWNTSANMIFSLFLSNYKLQLLSLAFKITDKRDSESIFKTIKKILKLLENDMWKELLSKE